MSINYARELLKISISQLCSAIGFDTTSQIAIDILVDVCERQFQYVAKQTSSLINDQPNFRDFLFILLENNCENLQQFQDYMKQFKTIQFPNDIIQFPYKKRNQFYLRIPPKDSEQVLERDRDETTDYIYDWLPLFPDQETPEQPSTINLETTLDVNVYNEQDRKFDKDGSHHPLTLLSFMSKNGDEPNVVPVGKRPNQALPRILYRPRRIMEIEAAAAAEKAKKEQLEKENVEKDQQQNSQPPLRLTISKPLVTTEKTSTIKKIPTTIDGLLQKKAASSSSLNSNTTSINTAKKITISPTITQPHETHSQPNPSTNSSEILSIDEPVLDLSKPNNPTTSAIKLPTLKLNIKNVSNPQITNNSETPPTATKKIQKKTITTKTSTNPIDKVNLKIRTSSLPLLGTNNEIPSMISPPISFLPTETSTISNELLIKENNHKTTTDIMDNNNKQIEQISSQNVILDEEKKKKKKKKHHHETDEKRIKIEEIQDKNTVEQMDIEPIQPPPPPPPPTTTSNPNQSSGGGVGAIRLKIKFGKPSLPSDEISSSTPTDSNEQPINPELKPNSLRLTLPLGPSNTQSRPPIISTINRTSHQRKPTKTKHIPQLNNSNPIHSSFQEDNTNSIDDLPLGERTSPNKTILNNIQTNFTPQQILSTPIKKKSNSNKKKPTVKRQNNTVGVAVIEERRIHHDSQEKIWICPSCNRPDNGQEAMIACDLCDDWYHWECVGIVEEPPESIPWFCPKCHRSNSSTTSAQGIKPSASSKAKRKRASALYQKQQQQQQYPLI